MYSHKQSEGSILSWPKLGFDATFALGNYRGMGRYTRQLVNAYPGPSVAFAPNSFRNADELPWPLVAKGSGPEPFWEQLNLPRIAKFSKVDLLLCGFNTSPIFRRCPPIVLVIHDLIFLKSIYPIMQFKSSRQMLGAMYRRSVVPRAIKNAAEILTVSESSKAEICSVFELSSDRVTVISNTISDFWFRDEMQNESDIFSQKPYILAVSGAAPSKNLKRLIVAFAQGQHSSFIRGVNLVVVGVAFNELSIFKALAKELGVGNNVILSPRVSDVVLRSLYQQALLFVFPSTSEGFGIPLLEAMAVGAPIICSSIPVFREIGLNFPTYFDPFSINNIKDTMILGLSQNRSIAKMQAAREHCKTYSYDNKKKEIINIFGNIVLKHTQ